MSQSEFPPGERMPEEDLAILSQRVASPYDQVAKEVALEALSAAKIPGDIEIKETPQTPLSAQPKEVADLYHSDGEHFPNSSDPAVTNRPPSSQDQSDAARFIRGLK